MRITIVGLGLIGGSLALDLRRSGWAKEIRGVESSPENASQAMERQLVDRVEELIPALTGTDLVILAVPVNAALSLLPRILQTVSDETTVVDMGSAKEHICQLVQQHPRRSLFVPSHPMAGTENSGPGAALSGLFAGKTAIICDRELSGPEHLRRVQRLYELLGSRLIFMSAREHDLHVAYVSHLSHITSFALANTVLGQEKSVSTIFDLAGGGFESTVRLGKSSPEMWVPIFQQNQKNVLSALESYIRHLQEFHLCLEAGDWEQVRQLMFKANQIRRVLHNMGKKGGANAEQGTQEGGQEKKESRGG